MASKEKTKKTKKTKRTKNLESDDESDRSETHTDSFNHDQSDFPEPHGKRVDKKRKRAKMMSDSEDEIQPEKQKKRVKRSLLQL